MCVEGAASPLAGHVLQLVRSAEATAAPCTHLIHPCCLVLKNNGRWRLLLLVPALVCLGLLCCFCSSPAASAGRHGRTECYCTLPLPKQHVALTPPLGCKCSCQIRGCCCCDERIGVQDSLPSTAARRCCCCCALHWRCSTACRCCRERLASPPGHDYKADACDGQLRDRLAVLLVLVPRLCLTALCRYLTCTAQQVWSRCAAQ